LEVVCAPGQVIKFETKLKYERSSTGIPEDWNAGGEAYRRLQDALGISGDLEIERITLGNLEVHGSEIDSSVRGLRIGKSAFPILDFSDYRVTINVIDELIPSIERYLARLEEELDEAERGKAGIVILLPKGSLTYVRYSELSRDLKSKRKNSRIGVFYVDQGGEVEVCGFSGGEQVLGIQKAGGIAGIAELAAPPSVSDFRNYVIERSDRWFGHYVMKSNVHVRTHYDCYSLILKNNWLYEYVSGVAGKVIDKLQPDVLLGFGLVTHEVENLTTSLSAEFRKTGIVEHKGLPLDPESVLEGSRVLLISDVVLTGNSATRMAEKVHSEGGEVVGLLCVVGLSNSVKFFFGERPIVPLVELGREYYYPGENDCPLCRCHYPKKIVKTLDDFRSLPDSINPYDFWEAVREAKAFSSRHEVISGRHYTYYISIEKLFRIYRRSIARQLVHQASDLLERKNSINSIVYPESSAARMLAEEIRDVLKEAVEGKIALHEVSRDALDDFIHQERFVVPRELGENLRNKSVLIVDDGCCSFGTFSAMNDLMRRMGCNVMGYMVVLSRASKAEIDEKISHLKGRFQYYYHWPERIYSEEAYCPECSGG
jgi:adenine/guanine phosphoribosyltransferase-like PRPP-binding protein